jgi:ubiquinone/menaquinone biosynthesis C-methylase UbiE
MPWRWPWSRRIDKVSGVDTAADDKSRYTVGGRQFLRDAPYVLPSDMGEINRLDFQHYMMRYALRGNYAAPIGDHHEQILDVGCGTGRWAIEMAQTFSDAVVTGVDITPPTLNDAILDANLRPANVNFVVGDVLKGLPFEDQQFTYTHQRYMIGAIPLPEWPRAIGELARLTRPDGWVEVVEADTSKNGGPALRQADAWVAAMLARRGLDIHLAQNLVRWLQETGLQQVKLR